jgi:hypothetical protein
MCAAVRSHYIVKLHRESRYIVHTYWYRRNTAWFDIRGSKRKVIQLYIAYYTPCIHQIWWINLAYIHRLTMLLLWLHIITQHTVLHSMHTLIFDWVSFCVVMAGICNLYY